MILQNMPEEQDTDLTPKDTSEDNPLEEHPVEQEGGEQSDDKGKEDASQPVKIGEKEYTPEQIAEIEKKASGYDTLLPDYTRKSQKLAEFEKGQPEQTSPEEPFYRKEGWQPNILAQRGDAVLFAAADAETGDELWRVATPYPVFGSPAIAGGKLYVGMGYGNVIETAEQVAEKTFNRLMSQGKSEAEARKETERIKPKGEVSKKDIKTALEDFGEVTEITVEYEEKNTASNDGRETDWV